jgi:hypothetical protein
MQGRRPGLAISCLFLVKAFKFNKPILAFILGSSFLHSTAMAELRLRKDPLQLLAREYRGMYMPSPIPLLAHAQVQGYQR